MSDLSITGDASDDLETSTATAELKPRAVARGIAREDIETAQLISPSPSIPVTPAKKGGNSAAKVKKGKAVFGLVIHAAVDGVALGATSLGKSTVEFVVFMAIMLHKAPASLGLGSFLLSSGLSKKEIFQYLFTFAAAAPITAILTHIVVRYVVPFHILFRFFTESSTC